MRINGLTAVTMRGGKTLVYLARGDVKKVQALSLDASDVPMVGGQFHARAFNGKDEEGRKRLKRFVQYGSCADGTTCTGQLTVRMDRNRTLIVNLRGPYDRNRNILFYQEFLPELATAREFEAELDLLSGTDIVLEKQRYEYTENT